MRAIHFFQRYSALVVVTSIAILVASANSSVQTSGIVLGLWHGRANYGSTSAYYQEGRQADTLALVQPVYAHFLDGEKDSKDGSDVVSVPEVIDVSGEAIVAASNTHVPVIAPEPQDGDGVEIYTVQEGDTVGAIAQAHDITVNTILWANTIDDVDDIAPGDQIFILPVAGLQHTIVKGESLDDIAEEYEVEVDQIIAFNDLPANGDIEEGDIITIPGGEKDVPLPEPDDSTLFAERGYVSGNGTISKTPIKNTETQRKSGNRFPYGYCTYYVAQKRSVPWRGNAGTWLYNARSMGYKTGTKAKEGAIVVTTDDSYYGHVAYVEKVKDGSIVVSEMNYNGWGKVNKREINKNSRTIRGYIY